MSDSDWHGPLKSRSTEGQALLCGRSTAQLLANSAGSSVRMPETQSKHTQSLCQRSVLLQHRTLYTEQRWCTHMCSGFCGKQLHTRTKRTETINEINFYWIFNVKADLNNLFSELIFSPICSYVTQFILLAIWGRSCPFWQLQSKSLDPSHCREHSL